MKVIYNNLIPLKGFKAINILGILFVRNGCVMSDVDMEHETIHTKQIIEMLIIFFYIWYAIEWIVRLIIERDPHRAYRKVSFEQEAYGNEKFICYHSTRKHFNWIKYLRK